jgi:hypothetical protein
MSRPKLDTSNLGPSSISLLDPPITGARPQARGRSRLPVAPPSSEQRGRSPGPSRSRTPSPTWPLGKDRSRSPAQGHKLDRSPHKGVRRPAPSPTRQKWDSKTPLERLRENFPCIPSLNNARRSSLLQNGPGSQGPEGRQQSAPCPVGVIPATPRSDSVNQNFILNQSVDKDHLLPPLAEDESRPTPGLTDSPTEMEPPSRIPDPVLADDAEPGSLSSPDSSESGHDPATPPDSLYETDDAFTPIQTMPGSYSMEEITAGCMRLGPVHHCITEVINDKPERRPSVPVTVIDFDHEPEHPVYTSSPATTLRELSIEEGVEPARRTDPVLAKNIALDLRKPILQPGVYQLINVEVRIYFPGI